MRLAILVAGLILAAALPVAAQERASAYAPAIPAATGEPHPEGNAYMRRNHMKMMKHDRDLTVHEGDRNINASLAKCFDCHAVKDDAGQPVTYESEKHFCRTCHDFAAVKVDCFMCHRSTPSDFDEPRLHALRPLNRGDIDQMQAYLDNLSESTPAPAQQTERTE